MTPLNSLNLQDLKDTAVRAPWWKFIYDLQSASVCAVRPTIHLENSSNGILPLIEGTAILNRIRVVGRLDGKQTRILLLLLNRLKQAVFVSEPSANKKFQAVSLKITSCRTAIKPLLFQKGLLMEIRVKMNAEINEVDGEQDVFKPDKIKKLAKGA